ncbi:sulfite exporter TauE/SafE [Peribacillus deserti]|uniref:Sulfite exporter TauE/SafE n=1 Tax=Peribacillus deserti TaxID=673318 RepID=A0ABS2QEL6_9BACI|nr:sulfite exporter TauE/SafE [Peribacillus deserti]
MEAGFISILALGFILGIKHAIEPDHVIGVSTIAIQSKKLSRSSLAGVFWGIGHTATLFIVGMLMILLKVQIPQKWAMTLEFSVGIMLVYFGIAAIFSIRKSAHLTDINNSGQTYEHNHSAKQQKVSYGKSTFMGFIHGLAGSAAMILLTMNTINSLWEGAFYILIFGAGTVAGMLCFTTLIGIPFVLSTGKTRINKKLTQLTGMISAVFGVYYMYNLGFTEGLFKLWL